MAHPGLAWICSRCCRERTEGQPHICKTSEERLAELQEAALAVLNLVVEGCAVCGRNATVVDGIGDPLCDEHVGQADGVVQDGENAAELRRLRALLAG